MTSCPPASTPLIKRVHDGRTVRPRRAPGQRVLDATTGALELFGVYLGSRLGLYEALPSGRAGTAAELADGRRHPPPLRPGVARAAGRRRRAHRRRRDRRRRQPAATRCPTTTSASSLDPVDLDHVAPLAGMVVGIARCSTSGRRPTAPAAACPTPATAPSSAAARAASTGRRSPPTWSRSGCPPLGPAGRGWPTRRPARRPRLRAGLVDHRRRRAPPGRRGVGLRQRRRLGRRGPRAHADDARRGGALRGAPTPPELAAAGPFDVVAGAGGAARPGPAGGGAGRRPRRAGRRRGAGRRRRGGRADVHRPRRRARADDVRLEHQPLPAGRHGRAAVGRARHRHAGGARCASWPPEAGFGRVEVLDVDAGFFRLYALRP